VIDCQHNPMESVEGVSFEHYPICDGCIKKSLDSARHGGYMEGLNIAIRHAEIQIETFKATGLEPPPDFLAKQIVRGLEGLRKAKQQNPDRDLTK
jgi:hypothetical protein